MLLMLLIGGSDMCKPLDWGGLRAFLTLASLVLAALGNGVLRARVFFDTGSSVSESSWCDRFLIDVGFVGVRPGPSSKERVAELASGSGSSILPCWSSWVLAALTCAFGNVHWRLGRLAPGTPAKGVSDVLVLGLFLLRPVFISGGMASSGGGENSSIVNAKVCRRRVSK